MGEPISEKCISTRLQPTLHIDTLIFLAIILKIASFQSELLGLTLRCSAGGTSIFEWIITEGDIFQNYGGKDQSINMYCE